jgi:cation diffusion facilitator family transporter
MSSQPQDQTHKGRNVTLIGAVVNLFLIVFKFVAGFFGHSQALIADAAHSVSDLFTDAVVLFGLGVSSKAPDENHHFGHARFETLSSAIVGLALVGVALYLAIQAGLNIYHHTERHPTWLAVAAAAVSIGLKEALYRYTIHVAQQTRSVALVANAWHHRSDALSSVAVLLGVVGAQIKPSWHIMDAYAALVVSFLILKVGLEILWSSAREFTDAAPKSKVVDSIRGCALSVDGVIEVHDLKVRTSGGLYQIGIHVVVDENLTVTQGHKIAKKVETCLAEELQNLAEVIVHVDTPSSLPAQLGDESQD